MNMTPAEKAKELIVLYKNTVIENSSNNMAKQCAIITVTEIIDSIPTTPVIKNKFYRNYGFRIEDAIKYWQSVLEHLKNYK